MGQLYVDRVRRALQHGFADSQSGPASIDSPSKDPSLDITPLAPNNPDVLNAPTPPPTPSISGVITEKLSDPDASERLNENESPSTVVLNSTATSMSASSTPTRIRSASDASVSVSPKYHPPPLLSRHASIESISKFPQQHSQSNTKELPKILLALSSFLFSQKFFEAAFEVGEIALFEYRETKEDWFELTSVLHLLGMITNGQDNFAQACAFFEEELEIRIDMQGLANQKVLLLMDQLGWLMRQTGELFGSLKHFTRVLALQRQQGNRNQLTLSALNGLGSVQTELGNLVQAREYFDEALSLASSFGINDPAVAQTLHNIGFT